jgi:hypothetical protein
MFTIKMSDIERDVGMLKKGIAVIRGGNWKAAQDILHNKGTTKEKILDDMEMAELAAQLAAVVFPTQGAEAIAAIEVLKLFVVFGKGGADFGDPVWLTHDGGGSPAM